MQNVNITTPVIRHLKDGLVLRRSSTADTEKLAKFNSEIHTDELVGVWTRDLMSGKHPTFGVGDFTIVENPETGEIVSSMNLIDQTWTYAGIPFKVGRPELVGTRPEYRKRGLVRQQFEVIHEWSKQRGQMVQAITGIPYYYRLFGYEMAMDLDGGRMAYASTLPKVIAEQQPAYRIRPAVAADIPFITECYTQNCQRDLVASVWDEDLWRHELLEKSPKNVNRRDLRIIESVTGEPTGFIGLAPNLWDSMFACTHYSLKAGASWWEITPLVLRYAWEVGQSLANMEGKTCDTLGMLVHENHPVFKVAGKHLWRQREAYAWYLRVPDLKGFLRLITPVLERRLSESLCPGFSGKLDLNFYSDGLRMVFEKGRLAGIESWESTSDNMDTAAFPGQTFLQLLFGRRNLDELRHAFPDCFVAEDYTTLSGDYSPVLEALFPRQNSNIWPIS
jgi:hypothetical protein